MSQRSGLTPGVLRAEGHAIHPVKKRHTGIATTLVAIAAFGAAAAAPASALPSNAGAAALPAVNMEKVVLAAQLDPHRPGDGGTTGALDSVHTVELALQAKGLLASTYVDQSFGSKTIAAWRVWEDMLGQTGAGFANGLPNLFELTELGKNRYTLNHTYIPGAWVTENGEKIDTRTAAMFHKAETISGTDMTIEQGVGDASDSAGTHLGGGVIDIATVDRPDEITARVNALRAVGFAAWYRNWDQRWHIHAVAISDPLLGADSHDRLCQVYQYVFGGEGLGQCPADGSVPGTDRAIITWEDYLRAH